MSWPPRSFRPLIPEICVFFPPFPLAALFHPPKSPEVRRSRRSRGSAGDWGPPTVLLLAHTCWPFITPPGRGTRVPLCGQIRRQRTVGCCASFACSRRVPDKRARPFQSRPHARPVLSRFCRDSALPGSAFKACPVISRRGEPPAFQPAAWCRPRSCPALLYPTGPSAFPPTDVPAGICISRLWPQSPCRRRARLKIGSRFTRQPRRWWGARACQNAGPLDWPWVRPFRGSARPSSKNPTSNSLFRPVLTRIRLNKPAARGRGSPGVNAAGGILAPSASSSTAFFPATPPPRFRPAARLHNAWCISPTGLSTLARRRAGVKHVSLINRPPIPNPSRLFRAPAKSTKKVARRPCFFSPGLARLSPPLRTPGKKASSSSSAAPSKEDVEQADVPAPVRLSNPAT